MQWVFTAAAERALAEAAAWSTPERTGELQAAPILLGLLGETECRAAMILARHGIDTAAVLGRWPGLARSQIGVPGGASPGCLPSPLGEGPVPPRRFSAEVLVSLAAASRRLVDYPKPLTFGTEHVLLGLADADHEVAAWLREHGLDADALEAEIHRHYGHLRLCVPEEIGPPVDMPAEQPASTLEAPGGASSEGPQTCQGPAAATESPAVAPCPPTSGGERMRLFRLIDAAANRAMEGLRVAEDYVRFALDDRHLTGELKGLRHELAAALAGLPTDQRLAARETLADVGTTLTAPPERSRLDLQEVLTANFSRLQQALRSLEEFAKVLDPEASGRLRQLRYRTYTLQRAVELTRVSQDRLAQVRLCVLLDGRASLSEFIGLARSLASAGVGMIQFRDKQLDDRRMLERACALGEITRAAGALFIVNDRPDLAALAGADGVHLGQEDLPVKAARTIVGPGALIGVSAHSIQQARQAVLDGANYLGVGPTFPSQTKQFDDFPGLDLLRAVAAEITLPAFAIGGIGLENLPEVLGTGIRRIAVSGAVLNAEEPATAARGLAARLGAGP